MIPQPRTMRSNAQRRFGAFLCAFLLAQPVLAQQSSVSAPPEGAPEKSLLPGRAVKQFRENDETLDVYERIERVEVRKNADDKQPAGVKVFRVVPAGTGVDRIPLGPEGKPADAAAYRGELEKLLKALEWASQTGRAQKDAYEKIAKKRRERSALIEATGAAFLFTWVAEEPRGDRLLWKYRMEPNPAYKPTSRATAIFSKVRGYVWLDASTGQLARVEADVADNISIGGFLAKIYKGSHFMQERYEIAPGIWLPSFSQYDFDGRKLFLGFGVHERTFYSNYRRIGPPKEAAEIIRAELGKAPSLSSDP